MRLLMGRGHDDEIELAVGHSQGGFGQGGRFGPSEDELLERHSVAEAQHAGAEAADGPGRDLDDPGAAVVDP